MDRVVAGSEISFLWLCGEIGNYMMMLDVIEPLCRSRRYIFQPLQTYRKHQFGQLSKGKPSLSLALAFLFLAFPFLFSPLPVTSHPPGPQHRIYKQRAIVKTSLAVIMDIEFSFLRLLEDSSPRTCFAFSLGRIRNGAGVGAWHCCCM